MCVCTTGNSRIIIDSKAAEMIAQPMRTVLLTNHGTPAHTKSWKCKLKSGRQDEKHDFEPCGCAARQTQLVIIRKAASAMRSRLP